MKSCPNPLSCTALCGLSLGLHKFSLLLGNSLVVPTGGARESMRQEKGEETNCLFLLCAAPVICYISNST